MKYKTKTHIILGAALLSSVSAQAFVLTNGNFQTVNPGAEPISTFPGWEESDVNNSAVGSLRNSAAFVSTTSLSGSTTAELQNGATTGGALRQTVPTALNSYTISYQFAVLGGGAAGDRVFSALLRHGAITTTNQINMRINANGNLQVFSAGAFTTLAGLAANVTTDAGTQGSWDGETALINTFQLTGNYATGTYSITLNGNTVSGLTGFQGTAPAPTDGLSHVVFNGRDSTKNFLVDNVVLVPEPSTLALGAVGAALGLRRRRK